MSKGTYSAVDFQAWFSDSKRAESLVGDELVVGVDVAKTAFYAGLRTRESKSTDILYFEREEILAFVQHLAGLAFGTITIVLEPTGTYGDPLIEQARKAGLNVVRIQGASVAAGRNVFDGSYSSHDGKSAYLLARLYLCGVGSPWEEHTESTRELRALADLDKLVEETKQRFLGPLEAMLARHWPELTEYLELKSSTLLELLATYGDPAAVASNAKQASKLMREVGGHFLTDEKIQDVLESARTTIGRPMTQAESFRMSSTAAMLRASQKHSNRLKQKMNKIAEDNHDTRPLTKFAGSRIALILVGMLGPLTNYDSPEQLEKAQGLNLLERSSGKTRAQKKEEQKGLRISKTGPGYVRRMMYWLAMSLINPKKSSYCPIARAWYEERRRRNGDHFHKAIVALMRKLVRALWWIARGEDYDGTKLFDVARLQRQGYQVGPTS